MPRTYTSGQRAALGAPEYELHVRVEVEDSSGGWQDFTALGGYDWIAPGSQWTDSVDSPAMEGTFTFIREHNDGTLLSLAPYMTASPLNVSSGFTSTPAVKGGRGLQAFIAYTAPGVGPTSSDWIEVFNGYIHDPSWGGTDALVECAVRDIYGYLMAQWTEADAVYSTPTGMALEDVMQAILDANPCPKLGGIVPLYVPGGPTGINVTEFDVPKKPVLLALRDLANQFALDCKGRYDALNQFRLTLFDPGRAKSVADYTLGDGEYFDIESMHMPTDDVRNKIKATCIDGATGATLTSIAEDTQSQAEFGVQFMEVDEGFTENINSQSELDAYTAAMLSDLSRPFATARIRAPLFWIAQTGDLIAVPGNGVEFDTQQNLGVSAITHSIDEDGESSIDVREIVPGQVKGWLPKGKPVAPVAQAPTISATYTVDTADLGNVTAVPVSPTGENVSVNYQDSGYYGVALYLCVSSTDSTRRWVDSGTAILPTDWFSDGTSFFQAFGTFALIPGVPIDIQVQAIGQRSGLLSAWFPLSLVSQAPEIKSASLSLTTGPTQLKLVVTAGQLMNSVGVEIADAPVGGTLLVAFAKFDLTTGAVLVQNYTLAPAQLVKTWYARLTPNTQSAAGYFIGRVGPVVTVAEGTAYQAPTFADLDAQALVSTLPPNMPSARVVASSTSVAADFTTAGVAQFYIPASGVTPAMMQNGGTTPTAAKFYRGDGTWQLLPGVIQATFYNSGSVLVAGDSDWLLVPFACTLSGTGELTADASGSVTVEVWTATYAAFPTFTKISASAPLTLSSAQKAQPAETGWTLAIAAGTYIRFKITGTPTTMTKLVAALAFTRA